MLLFFGALTARGATLVLARVTRDRTWIRAGAGLAAAVLAMTVGLAPSVASSANYGALTPRISDVFAFLRAHTEPGALVAARKYRAFHLFVQRRTIRPPGLAEESAANFARWAADNRVDYVVLKKSPVLAGPDYTDCPKSPLCTPQAMAQPVYANADYQVFRLTRR